MMILLGATTFILAFVSIGVLQEKQRKAKHGIVLVVVFLVSLLVSRTAFQHYREVSALKKLDPDAVTSVLVAGAPEIRDVRKLQSVLLALKTPREFLASRDNHGEEADFSIGFHDGSRREYTISRATKTRGAVVRIKGGGTVLYEDLEWLIPDAM